jgi:hypothetical protein
MEKTFILRPSFDMEFISENLYLIDELTIGGFCHEGIPCKHILLVHLKSSPPNEWIRFTKDLASANDIILFYDLLSENEKNHFSYLFVPNYTWNGVMNKMFKNRLEMYHHEKIEMKNNIIDILRNEIKELHREIVHLKFKISSPEREYHN